MFGRQRYEDGYADGVEAAIAVLRARGERVGGAVQPDRTEIEIRTLLLRQYPTPQHDPARS